jgi:hypothetical protein
MDVFWLIAERKIREAIEEGLFEGLPKGKPLDLESDLHVPEDLRMAYRVLKNAGFVPEEIELHKEIVSLRELIDTIDDGDMRLKHLRRLNLKIMRLNELRKRPFYFCDHAEYEEKILNRLSSI